MSTFIKFLGILIGDLVPCTNKFWDLYISLREIICIIMAPIYTKDTCISLETLIAEHHTLYMHLFKETLKPKHHFLLHYPRIMMKMGPLRYVSCMRFEAKEHKELKQNAKVVSSRRNASYTLALKHQLALTHRFMSDKGFEDRFSIGITLNDSVKQIIDYNNFKNVLPPDIDDNYYPVSWIDINGIVYKPGMILDVNTDGILRFFGSIVYILMNADRVIYYIYKKMETLQFSQHVHAFEVIQTKIWGCIPHKRLISFLPNSIHLMADGKYYVPCA